MTVAYLHDRPDLRPEDGRHLPPLDPEGAIEFLGDHVDDYRSVRFVMPYEIRDGKPFFHAIGEVEYLEERLLPPLNK